MGAPDWLVSSERSLTSSFVFFSVRKHDTESRAEQSVQSPLAARFAREAQVRRRRSAQHIRRKLH
jgi:hypothetical protein